MTDNTERDALAQVIQNAEDGDLTANGWSRRPGPSQRRASDAVLAWMREPVVVDDAMVEEHLRDAVRIGIGWPKPEFLDRWITEKVAEMRAALTPDGQESDRG